MGSDIRPFFNQSHFKVHVFFLGKLHQTNGACQAGRAATHKKYIEIDLFTFYFHINSLIDLCKTSPFAQFLRQTQILFLEILKCMPAVKIIIFLELEQN